MKFIHKIFHNLFPVEKKERTKFMLFALIMFGILYISGSLRSIKDSIIVPSIGSVYLSFIDLYFVLPSSVAFTILYTKLTNMFSRNVIYYAILISYGIFFLTFGYIIYPDYHQHTVSIIAIPTSTLEYLSALIIKWPITLFAIAVELWSPIILVLSFWQFANANISINQAKRFYPSFGLISNFALIIAGVMINKISDIFNHEDFIKFNMSLMTLVIIILIYGLYFTQKYINTTLNEEEILKTTQKLKLTVFESIKLISQSKYLLQIFIMIVSYGVVHNIMHLRLKEILGELFIDKNNYAGFMGIFTAGGGVVSLLMMLLCGYSLRRLGWKKTAFIPSFIALISTTTFFIIYLFKNNLYFFDYNKTLMLTSMIASSALILIKASKYSFFDSTKEMSYIPLDPELKIKGKAAIDLIGTRISDSGGAIIQSSLILLLGTNSSNLFIMIIGLSCVIICLIWMRAIKKLSKLYFALLKSS